MHEAGAGDLVPPEQERDGLRRQPQMREPLVGEAAIEQLQGVDVRKLGERLERSIGERGVGDRQTPQRLPVGEPLDFVGCDLAVAEREVTQPLARLQVLHGLVVDRVWQADGRELGNRCEEPQIARRHNRVEKLQAFECGRVGEGLDALARHAGTVGR